jgi:hypothetical protein
MVTPNSDGVARQSVMVTPNSDGVARQSAMVHIEIPKCYAATHQFESVMVYKYFHHVNFLYLSRDKTLLFQCEGHLSPTLPR